MTSEKGLRQIRAALGETGGAIYSFGETDEVGAALSEINAKVAQILDSLGTINQILEEIGEINAK